MLVEIGWVGEVLLVHLDDLLVVMWDVMDLLVLSIYTRDEEPSSVLIIVTSILWPACIICRVS